MFGKKRCNWVNVTNKLEDIELKMDYAKQTREKDGEVLFNKSIEHLEAEKSEIMKTINENCTPTNSDLLELSLKKLVKLLFLIDSYSKNTAQIKERSDVVAPQMLQTKLEIFERLTNLVIGQIKIVLFKKEISSLKLGSLSQKLKSIENKIANAEPIKCMDNMVVPNTNLEILERKKNLVITQIMNRQQTLIVCLSELEDILKNKKNYLKNGGKLDPIFVSESIKKVSVHDKKICHARAGGQPSIKIIRNSNQATEDYFVQSGLFSIAYSIF